MTLQYTQYNVRSPLLVSQDDSPPPQRENYRDPEQELISVPSCLLIYWQNSVFDCPSLFTPQKREEQHCNFCLNFFLGSAHAHWINIVFVRCVIFLQKVHQSFAPNLLQCTSHTCLESSHSQLQSCSA